MGVRDFRTPILMSRRYENREKEFLRLREVAEIFIGIYIAFTGLREAAEIFIGIYIAFTERVAGKLLHLHFAQRLSATNLRHWSKIKLIVRHL